MTSRMRGLVHVDAPVERAPQVAVGEHAEHAAAVDDDAHAEALLRHHDQALGQPRLRANYRQIVAGAHDVGDVQQQLAAERAAGMRTREVLGSEAARLEQRHGQRVAERERRRGAGRGREVERAGFLGDAHVEMHAGGARQRGLRHCR